MEEVINLAAIEGSVDFSMFGMFLKSDWVVKLVIVLLVIFSIQSWKLIIQKTLMISKQRKISKQFENHLVERSYHALCFGVPDANDPRLRGIKGVSFELGNILKITTNLARHRTNRQKQAVVFEKGRHAITRVKVREKYGPLSSLALIECRLETGRTHQIRVHLAHAGHGLVGDPLYGGRRQIPSKSFSEETVTGILSFPRQALHAAV